MKAPQHKYLRVEDLRRLKHLLFASRRPVQGRFAGRHASPQRGQSLEFIDYRSYMPGDEVGDIDWKVFGRTDKLFVKRFEHTTNMTCHLLVDASASMGFAGLEERGDTKYDHACRLAAAVAFLVTQQQDAVSLAIAQEGLAEVHRPGQAYRHLLGMLEALEKTQPGGEAKLAEAIMQRITQLPRRGLLVVVSDLLAPPEPILAAMGQFVARGGEASVFHVLHDEELHLPEHENVLLVDSETQQELPVHFGDVRKAYQHRMKTLLDTWKAGCTARRIDYHLAPSSQDYIRVLEQYLLSRAAVRG
ncbi:MAG: DUF58 domain-containing protein [Phycisphaeraceae bacterium]